LFVLYLHLSLLSPFSSPIPFSPSFFTSLCLKFSPVLHRVHRNSLTSFSLQIPFNFLLLVHPLPSRVLS
jgi:hypothetical protein